MGLVTPYDIENGETANIKILSRYEACWHAEQANGIVKGELQRLSGHEELYPVQNFLLLPWFKRRWVVQESVLNGCSFYCGSLDISLHAFNHAMFILRMCSLDLDDETLSHIHELERMTSEKFDNTKTN